MRALKTIVATAVIVFTVTTVAMAGVQHITQRDDAADHNAAQATRAQATYTVRLTEGQLERLAAALAKHDATAKHTTKHQRTKARDHQARHETADEQAMHTARANVQQSSGSSQHHAEPAHEAGHNSSGSGSGSMSGTHHSGHDGEGCD